MTEKYHAKHDFEVKKGFSIVFSKLYMGLCYITRLHVEKALGSDFFKVSSNPTQIFYIIVKKIQTK